MKYSSKVLNIQIICDTVSVGICYPIILKYHWLYVKYAGPWTNNTEIMPAQVKCAWASIVCSVYTMNFLKSKKNAWNQMIYCD